MRGRPSPTFEERSIIPGLQPRADHLLQQLGGGGSKLSFYRFRSQNEKATLEMMESGFFANFQQSITPAGSC